MSQVLKTLLLLSISGGLLALALFALKPFIKNRLPKSFQYYIWLLVLLRLALPVPGGTSLISDLVGGAPMATAESITEAAAAPAEHAQAEDGTGAAYNHDPVIDVLPAEPLIAPEILPEPAQTRGGVDLAAVLDFLAYNAALIWALGVAASLGYRAVCYSRFMRGIRREAEAVTPEQAEQLVQMKLRLRAFSNVTMLRSALAPVPMLVGIWKPTIIIPNTRFSPRQLQNVLQHELTHLRRHDTALKWFGVFVLSLHWFNPISYLIQREISMACELSCDEAVIKALDSEARQSYGDTLIDIASRSAYPLGVVSSSMSAKQNTLKERLVSIMEYRKPTKPIIALTLSLLLLLVGCAGTLGVEAGAPSPVSEPTATSTPTPVSPKLESEQTANAPKLLNSDPAEALPMAESLSIFSNEDIQAREERSAEMAAKLKGKIVKLATGGGVSAALDENGNFFLWGNAWDSRLDVPNGLPPIKDIALGQYQAVALDFDGKLHGWKSDMSGPQDYGETKFGNNLPPFVQIDANSYHTAAITADGKVYKWGDANSGNQAAVPKNLGPVKQIATGGYCTAALLSDGSIAKWGMADYYPKDIPVKVIQVACSYYGVYALGEDGKVYGEEKQQDTQFDYIQKPNMKNIVKIAGCMALDKNGKVYVWGNDNRYRRTDITDVPLNLPKITDIATDGMKAVALGADGKIYEWGYDNGSMPMEGGERTNFVALPKNLDGFAAKPPKYPPIDAKGITETTIVKTFEEFREAANAYPICKKIVVDGSFTISDDIIVSDAGVVINEGAVLTIESSNFGIYGLLENNGEIVAKSEVLLLDFPRSGVVFSPDSNELLNPIGNGKYTIEGGGKFSVYTIPVKSSDIEKYFNEKSPYNSITSTPGMPTTLLIDQDVTIPKGYSIWLNINVTVKVAKGVTLTNNGYFATMNEPIIEGKVVGRSIAYSKVK